MTVGHRVHSAALLTLAVWLSLMAARADAAVILPGTFANNSQDLSLDLLVVDLNDPTTLAPGTYSASQFNYQFSNLLGGMAGTVTPILLTSSGGNSGFTPLAIGNTVPYAGATSLASTSLGGADSFNLATNTTVYGGIFWSDPGGAMPFGANFAAGKSFIRYSTSPGTDPGGDMPVVGTPINDGIDSSAAFDRAFDFNVQVSEANIVEQSVALPEPASLTIWFLISGAAAGAVMLRERGRRHSV